eukprot:13639802-Alexandrium_andersonii.AAC.1
MLGGYLRLRGPAVSWCKPRAPAREHPPRSRPKAKLSPKRDHARGARRTASLNSNAIDTNRCRKTAGP